MAVTVTTNCPQVAAKLRNLPKALRPAVRRAIKRTLEYMSSTAQRRYLSGPRPAHLGVVTTRLRNSITTDVRDRGTDIVGRLGTNVPYAARHELGFRGVEYVRAHTRVIGFTDRRGKSQSLAGARRAIRDLDGNLRGYRRGSKTAASLVGSSLTHVQFVRGHTRNAKTQARPYLRPAIKLHTDDLADEVKAAIKTTIRKEGGAR